MSTRIDEIVGGIYRISTWQPQYGITFNQFLIADERPALIHTGMRDLHSPIRSAIRDGAYLASLYGLFKDTKRCTLLVAGRANASTISWSGNALTGTGTTSISTTGTFIEAHNVGEATSVAVVTHLHHLGPDEAIRDEQTAALIGHGPFGGQTPRGSGSSGPVRPASARHCRTSWLLPFESQNVIRPSRSTRSSTTGNDELHFAHRA
jgi:hypothetical protein